MLNRSTRPLLSPRWLAGLALAAVLSASCLVSCAPAQDPAAGFAEPKAADYSALPWGQAFQKLNDKLSLEYAFTEWKEIDWKARYAEYQPRIAKAEAANDRIGYYLALREYVYAIPDGHVDFQGGDLGLLQQLYGGSYGMTIAKLDDGTVAVTWLNPKGPAAAAGIKLGAELTAWDGKPARDALRATSALFGSIAPTQARLEYEKLRFLVRDPVGTAREATYKNPGAKDAAKAMLKATDDAFETLTRTDQRSLLGRGMVPERTIEAKVLPGNVGYIFIVGEFDLPASFKGDHTPTLELFRKAVEGFIDQDVSGIILDVRGNSGGSDQMVTDFMGSFYASRTFYEKQTWFNALTGRLELRLQDESTGSYLAGDGALYIEPRAKRYSGPIIALVDNACVSSGEGVALSVSKLNNGRVVGFTGTRGAFGMAGDRAVMPGGFVITFPWGQSLDQNGRVQLDSRFGEGGVQPNIRVPMTLENAVRAASGRDVVMEYALQAVDQMHRGAYR
jgi:carboxyl-terminal processing protease